MKALARICLWLYVLVFIGAGGAMLIGAKDAAQMVGVSTEMLEQSGVASLLNQLRYMGAIAIGFGAAVAVLNKQILTEKRHASLFVVVLLLMPVSRTISLFIDGFPHFSLLLLMLGEYGLFTIFFLHTKRNVWSKGKAGAEEGAVPTTDGLDPELAELAEAAIAADKPKATSKASAKS
ncbi:MAG: DUF4345 family protein [Polyangiaceae bacterium]|nr:DUF4345 family protein [Myxococcales bacterium]MCB9588572.1 DUF4345 family protein [Polyangiaceae bacterium]